MTVLGMVAFLHGIGPAYRIDKLNTLKKNLSLQHYDWPVQDYPGRTGTSFHANVGSVDLFQHFFSQVCWYYQPSPKEHHSIVLNKFTFRGVNLTSHCFLEGAHPLFIDAIIICITGSFAVLCLNSASLYGAMETFSEWSVSSSENTSLVSCSADSVVFR